MPLQTTEDAILALKEAVRAYGEDWVDPNSGFDDAGLVSCKYSYVHGTEERHCIVGYVLREKLNAAQFNRYEGEPASTVAHDFGVGSDATHILNRAQQLQDMGVPWGKVLTYVIGHQDDDDRQWTNFAEKIRTKLIDEAERKT